MPDHVGDAGDEIEANPLGDKKSHYLAMLLGFATGAFVSSMVVLATATAIATNTGS